MNIEPLSVHIGAQIEDVNLRDPLTDAEVAEIRGALLQWRVVFFRDQFLNHEQHVNFARRFGQPTPAHVVFGGAEDYPEVYSVAKHRVANSQRVERALRPWTEWHTDVTAAINPPFASILRGDIVPPFGGDTQWTNLALAYLRLSAPMQRFVEQLRCVHTYDSTDDLKKSERYHKQVSNQALVSEHPLVTVHPETDEKVLYASPDFVRNIVGLTPRESQEILHLLFEHVVRPEFTVRFKWTPGAVAFWDNRASAHLAPSDIFDTEFDRQFYRVTLNGEVPLDINGLPSKSLSGQPIQAL